jgi:hypothetical protein
MREVLGDELFGLDEPHARQALQGYAQRFQRRLVRIDGSPSCTDARYIPDVGEGGTVRGFYALATDITELRDSYARSRALAQRLEVVREDERRRIARSLLSSGTLRHRAFKSRSGSTVARSSWWSSTMVGASRNERSPILQIAGRPPPAQ